MNISKYLTRAWVIRLLLFAVAGSALFWGIGTVRASIRAASLAAVDIGGAHHLGDKFKITELYVDGHYYGKVGREGTSGDSCCVLLPKKWRPGLSVEVRWAIDDFSHENAAEVAAGNFDSVVGGGIFLARVPVERYEVAAHVWVHFFAGGKVRVVSSSIDSWGSKHPIKENDPHVGDRATTGKRIPALFSAIELAEMKRKDLERKQTYGDWR